MKALPSFRLIIRSLVRGGQHTVLTIFCIAIGVLAIVSFQLIGAMVEHAFTSNAREANGGDIQVNNHPDHQARPFTQADLAFFAKLQQDGTITNYTAFITANGTMGVSASLQNTFTVLAVNPATFPVVSPPQVVTPQAGTFASLLVSNQVLVTKLFADQFHTQVGERLAIHISDTQAGAETQVGRVLHVVVAGIVSNSGVFALNGSTVIVSLAAYQAADASSPLLYTTIDVTTADAHHTDQAVQAINEQLSNASTQTVALALSSRQEIIDAITLFLEIGGLLTLLIGGVGIAHAVAVWLSRRTIEIAVLKTTGYRRRDLLLLFGGELTLLGLIGGGVGAFTAIGVSTSVSVLVQHAFGLLLPLLLDWGTLGAGVGIGACTTLIFGLLPIAQAVNIRPLSVLRDMQTGQRGAGIKLRSGLLLLLSLLFCGLAILILQRDVLLGIGVTYGTFALLGIVSGCFGLLVLLLSLWPVPERLSWGYLLFLLIGGGLAVWLFLTVSVFGACLLVLPLAGAALLSLPRSEKFLVKMALRNLGRQKARISMVMLVLFVGLFSTSFIVLLGQNVHDQIETTFVHNQAYNLTAVATGNDARALSARLATIPGRFAHQEITVTPTMLLAINGTPVNQLIPPGNSSSKESLSHNDLDYYFGGLEGFNVAQNQLPGTDTIRIREGRNLNAHDAGIPAIVLPIQVMAVPPLNGLLHIGGTITLGSASGKIARTFTIVGDYQRTESSGLTGYAFPEFARMFTTTEAAGALASGQGEQTLFYMQIDPVHLDDAVAAMSQIAPGAFVFTTTTFANSLDQYVSNLVVLFTIIDALILIAGVISSASAVTLAVLERRREIGILKAVGYTSGHILRSLLLENALVGIVSACLAVAVALLATSAVEYFIYEATFSVQITFRINVLLILALILGAAGLSMLTAALVARGALRMRPLEVLRNE